MSLLLHVFPTVLDLLFIVTCIGLLATELWVIPRGAKKGMSEQGNRLLSSCGKVKLSPSYSLWRLLSLILSGLTLMSVVMLSQRTMEMSGLPWDEAFSVLPLVLSGTHYGMTWLVRITAIIVLWLGWWRKKTRASRRLTWVMMLAAASVVWSISASSHAADWGDFTWPEWISWLHIMAGSMWVGGILVFVLMFYGRLRNQTECSYTLFASCAAGLSRLAGIALVLVLATGVYNVWRQIDHFSDLWGSGYGRIILFKLALVGLMAMLGALGRYFGLPFLCREAGVPLVSRHTCLPLQIWKRLHPAWRSRKGDALARQFRHRVMMEAWLALGVLVCAALLGHAMPPKQHVDAVQHVKILDVGKHPDFHFESGLT